ncbi:fibronectin-binding autotransporter adhesin ShdA [Salmonella enterica subsp. enterica serovar Rissen]|nr:fibronectin-binding autotransporter adhesin ShdA [Salmonella enterica subsp. enterica serovar Rissen]
MNKTYNIIWNAARGMYIVTSELARSGSRAIVSVSASCAVTLLAMDAAPAVAEETRVSIPSQTTTYTLSGATPFVVETGNTVATDTATSAAIVGDNSNDWDLLIESGAVVGSSLTDSQAMNLDSLTGATSVHNQGTITGSSADGTILLQNGGSVINDGRIENSAIYVHNLDYGAPEIDAAIYMLNGGSYVSSENGVLKGVSGVIVQSGEVHITNGGTINSDGSWRSYGVELRGGAYGTIVNTGTIITTASDGSNKIEDAAIYAHTFDDIAAGDSVSVDNSGLLQSDFIAVALYHGAHFEVFNRAGGVITAGNSSLVGIQSAAMELKAGADNLVTNDGTISAYGTANTYGIHYGENTSGGVITNTGSITTTGGGSGDASVYVHGNGDGTVVNNSGTMSSTVYGVYLDSARSKGHTLNNQAGGAISANTAVAINGNGNTITNQGKMTGVSDGLLISGNNNIVTTSGGEISGKNGIRVSKGSGNQITAKSGSKITTTSTGISIAGGNNQVTTESGSAIVAKDNGILINSGANNVTNGGSITATGSSISYGIQYNSGASGTITNTGTITTTGKGAGDASVYAHGGAVTINNSGTMDSSVFGVYVTTGHTLNNLAGGSITANTAVQLNGNNNTLANAGAISGDTNGVTISGSGNTLTSQGKITGGTNAVLINSGSKNNTITLNTGTEISGSITDDNNSASANNNLILDGEGTLGSSISGLNSVTSSGDWTLSGATMNLSGTTNSALWVKSGTLIVNGAMTAKGATVDSGTTLQIGNGGTLGAFNGDIVDNGTLTFNRSDAAAYGSVISGSGNVVKQGGGELTLSNNNSYSGGTTIAEGTLTATAGGALGSGNIDNSGTLMLDANGAFKLANVTTHSGATTALAAGSTLDAGQFTQEDGSTLSIDLGAATDDAVITADSVTLGGTLNVTGIGSVTDSWTPEAYTYTLIDSDSAITSDFDDLTIAGMNREDVDFLTIDGKVDETDNTNYDLTASLSWYADRDNATTNAHGTFTLSDPDGSFNVAATLTDVDDTLDPGSRWDGKSLTKEGAGTLILSGDNDYSGGTTINEGTLVAASTTALGTGLVDNNATLVLDVDGEVSAVGGITTHSGATTQLALGTSLDLGDSALIQQDGSTLNVELNSDSVQPLITGGSATLGGDLVVSDASLQARASDAEFQSFKLMDMDSDISGDFTSLTMNLTDQPDYLTVTGTINPADASEYLLTEGLSWNATATSATPAHGTFTLGAGDSFEVTSVLGDKTGNGDWDGKSLTKLGAGKLTLSGANTYSGDTNVQEGTLWLAGDGTIGEVGSQQAVNVASGATFGGSNGTTVNGKVTNEGTLVFGDSEETGAIFTLNGDLINMGTMTSGSSSSTPGNTLYVDGNYTGNGGSLYLNTVLGDDDSATDKLVITGDASGTTDLYINGIGDGAQTTNGIEVVDVGGVSTSDAFELKNEVNAGLYTYRLYWNESDNDWYLASKAQSDDDDSGGDDTPSDGGDDGGNVTPPDDGGDGGNVTPPDDGGDGGDVTPPDDGGDVAPQYRADIGAYMGNQWMARNLQMQTLYDREGSQYRNADGSVWARFKAGKAESEAVSGNIDMDSNYSQFQLGGDILAWGNGQQSVTVGVMASYINADTDSTGNRGADGSQFTSSANVDGYNLGVYATWFADAQTHSGAYVDSWYQYGFYNNSVESGDAGSESYDSTANAVSLETGYRYDIALSNGNTVSLTPQAQVVWQNYSADSVKDNYGTRIDGQDGDSWTTRLGLRVDGKLYKGSRTVIQPFAEANWLHTSDDVSVSFDDATVKQDLPANRAELKVGLQADIDKQWSVRAQVAGQTGSNDFGDLNGSLNLRYNW